MSDEFEENLKRWLRDRAGNDGSAIQALTAGVAGLPPRRRRWASSVLAAAASIVVVVGLIVVLAPRLGGVGNAPTATPDQTTPGSTLPGGPDAFAGDPRLRQCYGTPADMEFVFEMGHARDYRAYLPRMGLSPELDVDNAAFAVVYRDGWAGVARSGGQGSDPASPTPGRRFVCVLVAGGDPNLYSDVDIDGLTVAITPNATTSSDPTADPTVPTSPPTTAEPAPAWVADLAGQLGCDGPVASLGGEYPATPGRPDPGGTTPETALTLFLGPDNPFASLPRAGFFRLNAAPHWASFGHIVSGRVKAIVLLSDTTDFGAMWTVVALRACDASEFDPNIPLTFPVTIWTDTSGERISTETVRSGPGSANCGSDAAIFLTVEDALYFRDPDGVMGEWTTTSFDGDAKLPATATDTGYRTGEASLWLDPGGDAYFVLPGRVERWPRSIEPMRGCM